MIKCIIVDDERQARTLISNLVQKNFPEFEIIGEAGTFTEFANLVTEKKPDLIFLDIQLGNINTMDHFTNISASSAEIIFVTTHMEYAADAFLHAAAGYLLKPINTQNFIKIVTRCLDIIEFKAKSNLTLPATKKNNLALNTSDGIEIVYIPEIIRVESDNNYSRLFLENESKILVSKTLKDFERILTDHGFIRVHQSHLVNIEHIRKFLFKSGGIIRLKDNTEIPVSSRKRNEIKDFLNGMAQQP